MGEPCSTPDIKHGVGKFYKTCLDLYNLEKTRENSDYVRRNVLEKTSEGKIVVCCPELGPRCISQREDALGTCIPLSECKQLFAMFSKKPVPQETREFLRNSQCGVIDKKPQVCCSDQDKPEIIPDKQDTTTTTTTSTTTRSTTTKTTTTEAPKKIDKKTKRILELIEEKANILPSAPDCGTWIENKIFGGKVTGIEEFNWLVMLKYRKRA